MGNFCIYCGAELKPGAKFCIRCGKAVYQEAEETPAAQPVQATVEQPVQETVEQAVQEPVQEPVAQPVQQPVQPVQQTVAQPVQQQPVQQQPVQQFVPQGAPVGAQGTPAPQAQAKRTNWVLIVVIAAVCAAVITAVVLLLLKHKTSDPFADVPHFTQSNLDDLMDTMLPEFKLLSYGNVEYDEDEQYLYIYDCRVEAPEGCLLDFSDMTVELGADLSDPDHPLFDLGKFSGTPRLKTGDYYTISDDSGHEIEIAFLNEPYISDNGLFIVFPDVFVADLYWLDVRDISDPSQSITMWFEPNYNSDNYALFPYSLYDAESLPDDSYTIYLNKLCEPAFYTNEYYS